MGCNISYSKPSTTMPAWLHTCSLNRRCNDGITRRLYTGTDQFAGTKDRSPHSGIGIFGTRRPPGPDVKSRLASYGFGGMAPFTRWVFQNRRLRLSLEKGEFTQEDGKTEAIFAWTWFGWVAKKISGSNSLFPVFSPPPPLSFPPWPILSATNGAPGPVSSWPAAAVGPSIPGREFPPRGAGSTPMSLVRGAPGRLLALSDLLPNRRWPSPSITPWREKELLLPVLSAKSSVRCHPLASVPRPRPPEALALGARPGGGLPRGARWRRFGCFGAARAVPAG